MPNQLMQLIKETSVLLLAREWKLVTIESCTGGGLAYHLTELPGSSAWFAHGLVTYSNSAKEELVGVKPFTLNKFGAVSAETAREMAEGGLRNSEAQISVSITGIAGPDGGSAEKPVGLVWFAIASIASTETETYRAQLKGDRHTIREQAMQFAMEKLFTKLT